jgi:ATP-dependent helicase HrpB
VTPYGRKLSHLGAHPRIAAMLTEAQERGLTRLGCLLAALLEERDILGEDTARTADIEERLRMLERQGTSRQGAGRGRIESVRRAAAGWKARLGHAGKERPEKGAALGTPAGFLLATAYPERVAARRGPAGAQAVRYLLSQGKGVLLSSADPLSRAQYIVAAEVQDARGDGRVFLAGELEPSLLEGPLSQLVSAHERVAWDAERGGVVSVRERCCGAILLEEEPLRSPAPELVRAAVLGAVHAEGGVRAFAWSERAKELQARVAAFRRWRPQISMPDLSDQALNQALEELLEGCLSKLTRRTGWENVNMEEILMQRLSWEERRALEQTAPPALELPEGKRRTLDYSGPEGALLSATVQELFGWKATPSIGTGEIPLMIQVLSPARRPVQVTRDLKGFWQRTYPEVRKELRGRYPKHRWPENPLA